MKVLVLFGHPAFQKSRVNQIMVKGVKKVEGVTFHDLYETYPDLDIDIDFEQQLLTEHDCIIFQHPLYWYSTPAIFKEWMDLVLEHGFAFGSTGNALKDKLFFNVITAGAPEDAFCTKGVANYTIKELLTPIFQTGNLCKMIVLPPFVTFGSMYLTEIEVIQQQQKLIKLLELIVNDELDVQLALKSEFLHKLNY